MTVQEMYEALGSDYSALKARLASEKLIKKLLVKYPNDKNFGQLEEGMAEKDYDKCFAAAHTIKGVASNLGFDRLFTVSAKLSDSLKVKNYEGVEEMFADVKAAQEEVLKYIGETDLEL